MIVDYLLDAIAGVIKEGQKSERKSLYYFAGLKYFQAKGMLDSVAMLQDGGSLKLSDDEEERLAILFGLIAVCLESLQSKMGNGKHHLSGAAKDSPKEAISAMIEEIRGF